MSRAALLDLARRCDQRGLNHGSTGNLSVRTRAGFLITPSAVPPDRLTESAMVELAPDGSAREGGTPSSEWRLHAAIYGAHPEAGAIVHTHSTFATTLACLRQDLPAVHYMLAITGGDRVRCSRYAPFGTTDLSAAALEALGTSRACLLANHGLVAVGLNLEQALRIAVEVEVVAEYWLRARAVGEPVVLSATEMADAIQRFTSYGGEP